MQIIPIFYCRDMAEAISFYTEILDFVLKDKRASSDDLVVDLLNGNAELQLTIIEGKGEKGVAVNVRVDDVDTLFDKYKSRGLDTSKKSESPVHQGPLNQTWGIREFYVTDPSGNTLRFGKQIE